MSKYALPEEAPKEKGDLIHAFRIPSTLETGARSLSKMASAAHRIEKLGAYGETGFSYDLR